MNIWVTTDGKTETQTQLASGDFADIVEWGVDENFETAIQAGYFVDLAQYKDQLPAIFENPIYQSAIEYKMERWGEGEHLWSLPIRTGEQTNIYAYNPAVRWDLYEKVGTPECPTWDDFLDVLEAMVKEEPTTAEGLPTYAISMSGGADSPHNFWLAFVYLRGAYLDNAGQLALNVADGSSTEKAIEDGSALHQAIQWCFEANQRGLMDPDGATQSAEDMQAKITNGQIMYTPFLWWGGNDYNTDERRNADDYKGYAELWAECMVLPGFSDNPVGNVRNVSVTTSCENLDAALSYLNWLYSDGAKLYANGPEGLFWEYDAEGNQVPTQAYIDDNGAMSLEFEGGGTMTELRYVLGGDPIVTGATKDPNTGLEFAITSQEAFELDKTYTKLEQSWIDFVGSDDPWDIYENTDRVIKQAAVSSPTMSDEGQAIQNDITELLWEAIVKMVYAKDQATFDSLWEQLKEDAEILGYEQWYQEWVELWTAAVEEGKSFEMAEY